MAVVDLAQHPLPVFAAETEQHPLSTQLFADQFEVQLAALEAERGVVARDPGAAVPQQHVAGAVFAGRDRALEVTVAERVVLGLYREALGRGIQARALRYRPALQRAIPLQAEVVVQSGRRVALDEEPQAFRGGLRNGRARLRRAREIALRVVFREGVLARHGSAAAARPRPRHGVAIAARRFLGTAGVGRLGPRVLAARSARAARRRAARTAGLRRTVRAVLGVERAAAQRLAGLLRARRLAQRLAGAAGA